MSPSAPLKRASPSTESAPVQVSAGPPCDERDAAAIDAAAAIADRAYHAWLARLTGGLAPGALTTAYFDWLCHLAAAPGKQGQLMVKAAKKSARLGEYLTERLFGAPVDPCIEPLPQDRRFVEPAWRRWPYDAISQSFLLTQQWWHNAATSVPGVSRQHERMVEFAARQILDALSPSNFVLTNPVLLEKTLKEGGANLARGWSHFLEDAGRLIGDLPPAGADAYALGQDLAATPGKIVYKNRLIELIRYEPTTEKTRPEPVLITPAWIMKYYVLDLSPHNSLTKYLVDQGFTVFMVSWRNPGAADRDLGIDDYRRSGVMDALDAIGRLIPGAKTHAVGYCLGGTLLAIAAAAMARDGDDRLKTLSLLAAQTDFSEAGELTLFITESQVTFLESLMWRQGYLSARQMAGAFQLMRSNDLIWSRVEHDYLMGERREATDLMVWNADATRMPYRMHSDYLRGLFLNNDLAEGRFLVDGAPLRLSDIRAPIFAVGTARDHVAPWRSVYKIGRLSGADTTFLLTSGGHNAGIVSAPGREGRHYRIAPVIDGAGAIDADRWFAGAAQSDGSWWPAWVEWLAERSGPTAPAPAMQGADGAPARKLPDAPGDYVRVR